MKMQQQASRKGFLLKTLSDEQGSVLVISLLVLVVLAMLGVVASNMSITEMQSSSNERSYNQSFYAAESGWQEPVAMLNSLGDDAPVADVTTDAVDLSALDTTDNKLGDIPYTYTITYLGNRKAIGFGDDYKIFQYQIDSIAQDPVTLNNRQQLRVVIDKPFAVD